MLRNCAIAGHPRSPEAWLDNAFDECAALLPLRFAFTDFTIRGSFLVSSNPGHHRPLDAIREPTGSSSSADHRAASRILRRQKYLSYPDRAIQRNNAKRELRAFFHESEW